MLERWQKNIGRDKSQEINSKYCQKFLDRIKQSATDALKTTSKRAIQKSTEATDDLIGNKIDDRITKVSNSSEENIRYDRGTHWDRYVSPEGR